jgi:hypothetical protein
VPFSLASPIKIRHSLCVVGTLPVFLRLNRFDAKAEPQLTDLFAER